VCDAGEVKPRHYRYCSFVDVLLFRRPTTTTTTATVHSCIIYIYYTVRYNGLAISKFAADAHCSTYNNNNNNNNILRIVYTWQPDAGPNTTTAADTVRAPPPPPLPVRKRISAVLISPTRVVDTYTAREAAASIYIP